MVPIRQLNLLLRNIKSLFKLLVLLLQFPRVLGGNGYAVLAGEKDIFVCTVVCTYVVGGGFNLSGIEYNPLCAVVNTVIFQIFQNIACADSVILGVFFQIIHNSDGVCKLRHCMLTIQAAMRIKVVFCGAVLFQNIFCLFLSQLHFKRVSDIGIQNHLVFAISGELSLA